MLYQVNFHVHFQLSTFAALLLPAPTTDPGGLAHSCPSQSRPRPPPSRHALRAPTHGATAPHPPLPPHSIALRRTAHRSRTLLICIPTPQKKATGVRLTSRHAPRPHTRLRKGALSENRGFAQAPRDPEMPGLLARSFASALAHVNCPCASPPDPPDPPHPTPPYPRTASHSAAPHTAHAPY
jgi:hypothetical protein